MFKHKKLVSAILAVAMLGAMSTSVFANDTSRYPEADNNEGSIGQTYVKADGTKVKYFNGEIINPKLRATETLYNGAIFIHDSWWGGGYDGRYAYAETEAYKKGDQNTPHRNYTRVRVVDAIITSHILEDTDRQWGERHSSAQSSSQNDYFEIGYAMRSYWGDSTT